MKVAGVCHECGKPSMSVCSSCGMITCDECQDSITGLCHNCSPAEIFDDTEDDDIL